MARGDYDQGPRELALEIAKWHFVATELNLFLDTHPDNKQALQDYNEAVLRMQELDKRWNELYGPMMNHGHAPSRYPWQWVEDPWPWDLGY